MNEYRTHTLGELTIKNVGENVKLSGWVQRIRDLGAMKFINLRDEFGITQIVVSEDIELNTETVIKVEGKVVERESKNHKIPTGEIEVLSE